MAITKENPNPPRPAPTEPKGITVEPAAAPPAKLEPEAPRIRGFAPPIIDTMPTPAPTPAPSSGPVKLPKLWLAFHSDGKALYCTGALQRDQVQRLQFDPRDPIIAQAYTYFVKQMMTLLDGGQAPVPNEPPPPQEQSAEPPAPVEPLDPKSVPLAELKTRDTNPPAVGPVLRRRQVEQLEPKSADADDVVPPTNPNPEKQ